MNNPPVLPEAPAATPPARLAIFAALLVLGVVVGANILIPQSPKTQLAAAATTTPEPAATISVTAESAYVYDLSTNQVLFSKNAGTPLALASITKLMLAAVVSEHLSANDIIPITASSLYTEGDSGLIAGESWYMQDLLDFTLIMSSNDGARALAEAAGKVIISKNSNAPQDPAEATVWEMNNKAKELGLTKSYFLSSSGLDASETMAGAYGSARDIAVLLAYLVRSHPNAIASTAYAGRSFFSIEGFEHTAYATNESIGMIPGLIAGKTGFTDLAGGNLAVAFDTSLGHPIVIVVLGSTKEARFADVEALANFARSNIGE